MSFARSYQRRLISARVARLGREASGKATSQDILVRTLEAARKGVEAAEANGQRIKPEVLSAFTAAALLEANGLLKPGQTRVFAELVGMPIKPVASPNGANPEAPKPA